MPLWPAQLQFQNVKTRRLNTVFADVSFVIAEIDERVRQHQRILAVARDSDLNGRAVVYADAYVERREATYIYARHKWDAAGFLRELDRFLAAEFPDWIGRKFPVVMNIAGTRHSFEAQSPFSGALSNLESIHFAKFTFPFGPITIEFGPAQPVEHNFTDLTKGQLVRTLETPLIGCDVTRTELVTGLIAHGHWASSKIPNDILRTLLLQAAPAFTQ